VKTRDDFAKLFNRLGYKIGVEVGTQKGEFAEYLLRNCNSLELLYCIDAWEHRVDYHDIANVSNEQHLAYFQETCRRLHPFHGRYVIKKMYSVEAANLFDDDTFSFVYIDADHSKAATLADLNAWYPKVRPCGILAGHDYLDGENICGSEFGVRSAVTEFMRDKPGKIHQTREMWPSWYIIKEG